MSVVEIISDKRLEKALDFLRENEEAAAKAKATRKYIEEFLPALRAQIAVECLEKGDSATAADMKAKASQAYRDQLTAYRIAVEEDELMRSKFSRADLEIEIWRSDQARIRSMHKVA